MPTPSAPVFVDPPGTVKFLDEPIAWTQPIPTFVAGVATLDSSTGDSANLSATQPSGGVLYVGGDSDYIWQRRQGAGGSWADLPGEDTLSLAQTGLAAEDWYYRLKYTDRRLTVVYSNIIQVDLSGMVRILTEDFDGADVTNINGRTPAPLNTPGNTWVKTGGGDAGILANKLYFLSSNSRHEYDIEASDFLMTVVVTMGSASSRSPYIGWRRQTGVAEWGLTMNSSTDLLTLSVTGESARTFSVPISTSTDYTITVLAVVGNVKVWIGTTLAFDVDSAVGQMNTKIVVGCTSEVGVRFNNLTVDA